MCSLSKGCDQSNNTRKYMYLITFVKVQFSMTKIHLSTKKIITKLKQQEIKSSVSYLSICHRTVAKFVSHISCMTPTWQKVNQTFFSNTVAVSANVLFTILIPAFTGIPSCSIVIIIITPFPQSQGTGTYKVNRSLFCWWISLNIANLGFWVFDLDRSSSQVAP